MPDRPTLDEARRDSVQDAIEKITGTRPAMAVKEREDEAPPVPHKILPIKT